MIQIGNIWGLLILFSVSSFALISVVIIIKGYGEIRDIFKKLGEKGNKISQEVP